MAKAVDSWAKLELMSGVIGKIIVNHGTQTKWPQLRKGIEQVALTRQIRGLARE